MKRGPRGDEGPRGDRGPRGEESRGERGERGERGGVPKRIAAAFLLLSLILAAVLAVLAVEVKHSHDLGEQNLHLIEANREIIRDNARESRERARERRRVDAVLCVEIEAMKAILRRDYRARIARDESILLDRDSGLSEATKAAIRRGLKVYRGVAANFHPIKCPPTKR